MKITKNQIKELDMATLLFVADWINDYSRRLEMACATGKKSKAKEEYDRALAACRRGCLRMVLRLAEYAGGSVECADEITLIPCLRCDCCGWPITENCGDEYSVLCAECAGGFQMGSDAVEYIKNKTK